MYNQKHKETEIIQTIQMLLPQHPELKSDVQKGFIDFTKYTPKETLVFSTAANLYDIPESNVVIMRYMDYEKFKFLINTSSLYMPTPDSFNQDPNEGNIIPDNVGQYITKAANALYKQLYPDIISKKLSVSGLTFTGNETVDKKIITNKFAQIYKHNLKRFFISCWTERDIDQDNMWKSYISSNPEKAVAIKTTVGKLKKALSRNLGLFALTRVKYVDIDSYNSEKIDFLSGGMWALACYALRLKDKRFEDDKEIRLICDNLMTNRTQWYKTAVMLPLGIENFDYSAEPEFKVLCAPLVLDDFIDEIITSPSSNDTFIKELQNFLGSKGLSNIKITKSKINKKRKFYWDE